MTVDYISIMSGNPNFGNLLDGKRILSVVNLGGKSAVLFNYAGNGEWWLLTLGGSNPNYQLQWHKVANTHCENRGPCTPIELGDLTSSYREIWIGDFQTSVFQDNSAIPDKILIHELEANGSSWLGT